MFFSSKINKFSQKMHPDFYRETFQPFLILLPNVSDVLQPRLHVALKPRIHLSALMIPSSVAQVVEESSSDWKVVGLNPAPSVARPPL